MQIVDLTQCIRVGMPVYPGTAPVGLAPANTLEAEGFCETMLTMTSHTGTHIDAPAHLLKDGLALDRMPASAFVGSAIAVPCIARISMQELAPYRRVIEGVDFVLFHTGQSRLWGMPEYLAPSAAPEDAVIDFLLDAGKKGVGIDSSSIDPVGAELKNHKRLFEGDMIVIENLTGLVPLCGKVFTLCALPLKFADSDGAPARVVALYDRSLSSRTAMAR